MWRKIIPGVVVAVLVMGALAAVGGLAYRAGVMQGLAQEGKIEFIAPAAGAPGVYSYHAQAFFHPFGFLACLGRVEDALFDILILLLSRNHVLERQPA